MFLHLLHTRLYLLYINLFKHNFISKIHNSSMVATSNMSDFFIESSLIVMGYWEFLLKILILKENSERLYSKLPIIEVQEAMTCR